jgi:TIR domain-containing protein
MNDVVGWIFVSHSTKDLEAVRRVRDYLESKRHQPLLFFLKCIRDTDELDSLITREIEARTIFLLCDSPNSRSARWVQREVEFIRSLPDRHYEVVDLQLPWSDQHAILDRISQRGTRFLSYTHSDSAEVSAIHDALRAFDYSIFFDRSSLAAGDDWRRRTEQAIDESLSKGFFIYFVSPVTYERQQSFQFAELHRALQQRLHFAPGVRNFIPVLIGDPSAHIELPPLLTEYQFLDLRGMPALAQAERLHRTLCSVANEFDRNA